MYFFVLTKKTFFARKTAETLIFETRIVFLTYRLKKRCYFKKLLYVDFLDICNHRFTFYVLLQIAIAVHVL